MKWLCLHLWILNLLLSASAWAQFDALGELKEKQSFCYGREYLDHEISANTGQIVKQMLVSLNYYERTETINMLVRMTLQQPTRVASTANTTNRISLRNYETELHCIKDPKYENYLVCSSPCFEGGAVVSWDVQKANINTLFFANLGVPLRRCTPEDMVQFVEFRNVSTQHLPNNRGNSRFTLFALPDAFCE